jgi:hypothetical protein
MISYDPRAAALQSRIETARTLRSIACKSVAPAARFPLSYFVAAFVLVLVVIL